MNKEAINQRIQALESELAKLKVELSKVDKFKFRYTDTETSFIGAHWTANYTSGSDPLNLENFRYRQTEANANADFQLQKELMCIGALAEQIDSDYKTKVKFDGDTKYAVIYKDDYYQVSAHNTIKYLGVVYMPKDVAEKVCEILNNKEVEL